MRDLKKKNKNPMCVLNSLGVTMGTRKSKPVDPKQDPVELKDVLVNENQETSPSHFQVDADFFDLSDPEKQESADEEKR